MCKVQMLRAAVNQRLTAAAEEIFGLFERTIAEYEEQLCRSKQNQRQRKLLEAVFRPELRLHRADVQQLLGSKEEVPPEQQERSPSLDQEDPPEPPHIKEEQEELWTSQEGEQLRGLEEADITEFPFTPVPVKSEEDEEKPQSSQHLKTEADGEDCGGSEPARNFSPDHHLQPAARASHSSEAETDDDSCDWEETREPQSGLNSLQNNKMPLRDEKCNTGKKSSRSSESAPSFGHKGQKHNGVQTGEKPFSCSVCSKTYTLHSTLKRHLTVHTGEKRFSCSVCGKGFGQSGHLRRHMTVHTGEKPFICSVCGKRFSLDGSLRRHLTVHTGEKPFICSVCGKRFSVDGSLKRHLTVHTGEKPFSCSVCGKGFRERDHLRQHLTVHTGEKRFSCSVCNKGFTRLQYVREHKCVGESSRNK